MTDTCYTCGFKGRLWRRINQTDRPTPKCLECLVTREDLTIRERRAENRVVDTYCMGDWLPCIRRNNGLIRKITDIGQEEIDNWLSLGDKSIPIPEEFCD